LSETNSKTFSKFLTTTTTTTTTTAIISTTSVTTTTTPITTAATTTVTAKTTTTATTTSTTTTTQKCKKVKMPTIMHVVMIVCHKMFLIEKMVSILNKYSRKVNNKCNKNVKKAQK
jgi:hypothetical protein